jgi:glycogen(starch) synthase
VEALTPTNPQLRATIESMEERGIQMVYVRWLIEGAPRVLLIDTKTAYRFLDEWKADLWNTAAIPSPAGDSETNEAIVFGYLVAWFLGEVPFNITHLLELQLTPGSTWLTRRKRLSLPTSTNG